MGLIDADKMMATINTETAMHTIDGDIYVRYGDVHRIVNSMARKIDGRTDVIDTVATRALDSMEPECTSWEAVCGNGDTVLITVTAQVIKEADDGMD